MSKLMLAISNHSYMLGGGEYSFLDLLSSLPQNWHVLAALPEEGELATRLKQKGIETQIIPLPSIRPWNAFNALASLRTCYNLCHSYRPALIYANGSRAALYGGIVGRILKLPVIWHCRIADSDILLDFILARLSSRVIANSRATANRFGTRFQSKIRVIHNGVNLDWLRKVTLRPRSIANHEIKIILTVARVSREKRHDLVISAFERVAISNPKARLICIGSKDPADPEWWNHLQTLTHRSPFSNRIQWLGFCSDVRPWYRSAFIFVLGTENEAFGRVLVEAMACGVPVVAMRSGAIPEIVRHGQDGLLVSPGGANEMASAMSEILKNEDLRRHLAKSATKRAEAFSLRAHVEKMVHLFEDAVKN